MADLVTEVANALVPMMAVGGRSAVGEIGSQLGRDFTEAARRLLSKLHGSPKSESELRTALSDALEAGRVTQGELKALVELNVRETSVQQGGVSVESAVGKIVVAGVINAGSLNL